MSSKSSPPVILQAISVIGLISRRREKVGKLLTTVTSRRAGKPTVQLRNVFPRKQYLARILKMILIYTVQLRSLREGKTLFGNLLFLVEMNAGSSGRSAAGLNKMLYQYNW